MILPRRVSGACILLGLLLGGVGCAPPEEADSPLPVVEFKGEVDSALAGSWRTDDGMSVLALSKDGALGVEASTKGQGGTAVAKKTGQWRRDGDRLLLRYGNSDGSEQTVGYAMKVTGETMTLSTKVPKRDTVYKRTKK